MRLQPPLGGLNNHWLLLLIALWQVQQQGNFSIGSAQSIRTFCTRPEHYPIFSPKTIGILDCQLGFPYPAQASQCLRLRESRRLFSPQVSMKTNKQIIPAKEKRVTCKWNIPNGWEIGVGQIDSQKREVFECATQTCGDFSKCSISIWPFRQKRRIRRQRIEMCKRRIFPIDRS